MAGGDERETEAGVVPRPIVRRGSLDRDRLADADYLLDVVLHGYLRGAEELVRLRQIVDITGYDRGAQATRFLYHLFFMQATADPRREDGSSATFAELIDESDEGWNGPIGFVALARVLRGQIEWGAPDWAALPDVELIDAFMRARVSRTQWTVEQLFRDAVFPMNAAFDPSVTPKKWGLAGLQENPGGRAGPTATNDVGELSEIDVDDVGATAQVGGGRVSLIGTDTNIDSRSDNDKTRYAIDNANSLRALANGLLDTLADQAGLSGPAILLGVSAAIIHLATTTTAIAGQGQSTLLASDREKGFHQLAIPVSLLFDPEERSPDVHNQRCTRAWHLAPEMLT